MPFMPYAPRGDSLQAIRQREMSIIVLVAEADEHLTMTMQDLAALYLQEGFHILRLPMPYGDTP